MSDNDDYPDEREEELLAALMVYDVTLACLEPFLSQNGKELMAGQIKAARDAYRKVTGDEPFALRPSQQLG